MIGKIINLPLLMNPVNWGIVVAVLLVMTFGITHIAEATGGGCNCGKAEE